MLQFCFVIVDEENRGVGYCLWRRFGKTHTLYLSPLSSRLGGILDEWTSSDLVKIAHLEKNAVGEEKICPKRLGECEWNGARKRGTR